MARQPLIVVGAGGFGPELVWAARNSDAVRPTFDILGYCDDDPAKRGVRLSGQEVLGTIEEVAGASRAPIGFACAIGDNAARSQVVARALAAGWRPLAIIDPSVTVADGVVIGAGSYVGAGTIVSPNVRIGEHVVINQHCSIGHDSILAAFSQVSPGGRVSGNCRLDEGALMGSNAVLAPGRRLGRYATLGAASFAVTDVPDDTTAIGNPARVTMRRS